MTAYPHFEELPLSNGSGGPFGSPDPGAKRFNDILAAVICSAGAASLSVFTTLSPYPATLVIGVGGLIAVYAALYVKYRGRLAFDCETAFVLGATLQYLFAPAFIRFLTSDFETLTGSQTAERYGAKDAYGQGMVIVVLFFAAYFAASAFFPVKRPMRDVRGRLAMAYSQRTVLVMMGFTVMLWLTRAALLASGSFYHVHRSRFQAEDPRYSAWTQFDGGMGPLIISFLWGALFLKKIPGWIVVSYTVVDFGWNFISGGRERTIIDLIVVVLTFIVYRNRIPWKALAIAAVPVMFLIGFMDYYRYAVQRTAETNTIQLSAIVDAFSLATRESESSGATSTILRGVMRFNDLESIAAIHQWTGTAQPFLGGETYGRIPAALVPRYFWPDKPMVVTPINEWYFRHEGGTSPLTTPGEGFINFGWPGVVLAGLLAGFCLRIADTVLMRFLWNAAILPVYIGSAAVFARIHTQPMAVWITTIIKMLFLAVVAHVLTLPRREEAYAAALATDPDHPGAGRAEPYGAHSMTHP